MNPTFEILADYVGTRKLELEVEKTRYTQQNRYTFVLNNLIVNLTKEQLGQLQEYFKELEI